MKKGHNHDQALSSPMKKDHNHDQALSSPMKKGYNHDQGLSKKHHNHGMVYLVIGT
jgi:hypothetical protein